MATPMQEQYNALKNQYPDCILLFRLGDFYEAFNDDAKKLSKILGITLTGRGKEETRIPMAGIPYHSLEQYLPKLIKAGEKVAIAEQTEPATEGKLVERKVAKVITAGTITDEKSLDISKNNYIACILKSKSKKNIIWGIAFAELTTGELEILEIIDIENYPKKIVELMTKYDPNEILFNKDSEELVKNLYSLKSLTPIDDDYAVYERALENLNNQFESKTLKGFGIDEWHCAIIAASEILNYLKDTQKTDLLHFKNIKKINVSDYMIVDDSTIKNLEIFHSSNSDNNSLYNVLNNCSTPMGQRLLRFDLVRPLIKKEMIEERLQAVKSLVEYEEIDKLKTYLSNVYDIERIVGKIGISSANARDLKALAYSLSSITEITNLNLPDNPSIQKLVNFIKNAGELSYIVDLINKGIKDNPSALLNEGHIINDGYDTDLDELRKLSVSGNEELMRIQTQEVSQTGITSLKVKFNNVFGYYIEISKSNLTKVPGHYIRKQTLVNAERFITEELKILEDKILGAKEKIIKLEYELFTKIRSDIAQYIPTLIEVGKSIARIDVYTNHAFNAKLNNYCLPEFNDKKFEYTKSRHPVVEKIVKDGFIDNDISLDKKNKVMILTGPNMSGKSTYIRQVALIALMAQIGSFVPAEKSCVPIFDRIFTRVGAADNLSAGESTFMVEMVETANILNNATDKSLIILDEVGRGTSTYDGIAIAWSITQYIHDKIGAYTLFATHYHELVQLEKVLDKVVNYNVAVKEDGHDVIFLRKIVKGSTDKSYGIYVAKIAGVPGEVINSAREALDSLEKSSKFRNSKKSAKPEIQFAFFQANNNPQPERNPDNEIIDELKSIDLLNLTPLNAFEKLKSLQEKLFER